MRRSFHVAAMPFPSPQGTQAAIAAMLDALSARGDCPELLTYAHAADQRPHPYRVHRLFDFPRDRSLRSGPSLQKVLLDAQLAVHLAAIEPTMPLIAHHVEAAAACWLSRRPFVFFAHTDLEQELPTYTTPALSPLLSRMGGAIDRTLICAATSIAAISPRLAESIEHAHDRPAHYVPTPWPARASTTDTERATARSELGLDHRHHVLLYAGNLDAYQGWEVLIAALTKLNSTEAGARLLVATQSNPEPLMVLAHQAGVAASVALSTLASEADRQRCHAAADVCVIPRRAPGGLPIKLLEGLSRRVPIVTSQRATAGLPLNDCASITSDGTPDAIAANIRSLRDHRDQRDAQIDSGSAYLREHHSVAKFLAAFDRVSRA